MWRQECDDHEAERKQWEKETARVTRAKKDVLKLAREHNQRAIAYEQEAKDLRTDLSAAYANIQMLEKFAREHKEFVRAIAYEQEAKDLRTMSVTA